MANLNTKGVDEPQQTKGDNEPQHINRPLQDFPHEILVDIIACTDFCGLRNLRATRRVFANLISTKMINQRKPEGFGQLIDFEGQKIHRLVASLPNSNRKGLVRLGLNEDITSLTCYGCLNEKPCSEFSAASQMLPFFLPPPRIEGRTRERFSHRAGVWVREPHGPLKPPALDRRCRTCHSGQYRPPPACIGCATFGGWKRCDDDEWIKSDGIYCTWDRAFAPRMVMDKVQPNCKAGPFCDPCRTRYFDDRRPRSD